MPKYSVMEMNALVEEAQGYTQRAKMTKVLPLVISQEVAISLDTLVNEPTDKGEARIVGGNLVIPREATGRWALQATVNIVLAATLSTTINAQKDDGSQLSDYPQFSSMNLAAAKNQSIGVLPVIYKPFTDSAVTISARVIAGLGVGLTSFVFQLTKLN